MSGILRKGVSCWIPASRNVLLTLANVGRLYRLERYRLQIKYMKKVLVLHIDILI